LEKKTAPNWARPSATVTDPRDFRPRAAQTAAAAVLSVSGRPWFRGTPHAPHRPHALRCRPYPLWRGFVEAKAFFASPSLAPAHLTVDLCHVAASCAPTLATSGRATPRQPPRAPLELGPPPRTIGRRSEPTTGDPAPSCSSPMATLPVSAFFIHSPARPTRPPVLPKSQEPRRPLQLQPRPLLWPTVDDTPPPERRYRGEPLTVSFPYLHHPKSDPRAAGVPLGLLPHSLSPPVAGLASHHNPAPWSSLLPYFVPG
jgi:hypothetical protein